MDLDAVDLPDLVGAVFDRYYRYGIGRHQALHITCALLDRAYAAVDAIEQRQADDPLEKFLAERRKWECE